MGVDQKLQDQTSEPEGERAHLTMVYWQISLQGDTKGFETVIVRNPQNARCYRGLQGESQGCGAPKFAKIIQR